MQAASAMRPSVPFSGRREKRILHPFTWQIRLSLWRAQCRYALVRARGLACDGAARVSAEGRGGAGPKCPRSECVCAVGRGGSRPCSRQLAATRGPRGGAACMRMCARVRCVFVAAIKAVPSVRRTPRERHCVPPHLAPDGKKRGWSRWRRRKSAPRRPA